VTSRTQTHERGSAVPARSFRRAASLPLAAIIVALLSGCDNVMWGGADIEIVPPPPAASMRPIQPDERMFAEFGLPRGSVIFHLTQSDGRPLLVPVGEISGDTLRGIRPPGDISPEAYESRFREAVIPIGTQFEVFRRGARVGTFTVQGTGPPTACRVPTATGNVSVVAAAADVTEFLAFRQGLAPQVRGEYSPPQITGTIRTYASILAERLILQAGLPRPRSWPGAQRDLQAIEIMPGAHPEMAATYLVGDSLAVGPADPQGYSVFYLADFETRRGYTPIYSEIRDYRRTGKGAPRVLDHLNWDEDEGQEVLIQIFGENQVWYDAVSLRNGTWTKIFEGSPC
jgi:hypothetical protein